MNSTCELGDDAARALRPYPAYKDSGIEWLGQVPAHWDVRHLGRIGRFFKGGGGTKEDETEDGIPCVRYGDLYTHHRFFITASRACVAPELAATAYMPIAYGDVLFAGSGETMEEIGKSAVNLIRGPACCGGDVIVFRPSINAEARFFGYMADCSASAHQKACIGRGFTVMHIYSSDLKYMTVAIPPVPEQAAIVRFLDYADRRIRRYIRAKQKLIALLEERKDAMVHQAITGTIDVRTSQLYPAYKLSHVEWLGEVPETWDVVALRHRYSQCLGKMLDSKRITGDYSVPYLRNVDIQWDQINVDNLPIMDISPHEYERFTVKRDDLLVCEGGEVGRCALWSDELTKCGFQKALHRLRPRTTGQDVPRFMHYVLRAAARSNAFDDGHLSTITHLTGEKLRLHRLPFPPVAEQENIVGFLDDRLARLDRACIYTLRQVECLNEYRTRLIAEVVTGKLDVREVAAGLPDSGCLAADQTLGRGNATHDVSGSESDAAVLSEAL